MIRANSGKTGAREVRSANKSIQAPILELFGELGKKYNSIVLQLILNKR